MRRLSQINLNALRVAESVARNESFTLAAEESCITPSAVSQQIKKLEDQLEFRIFNRANKKVSLTQEGEEFILTVREALDDIISRHNKISARDTDLVLKVSVLPTFAVRWLLPRLSRFQQKHPEIQVHMSNSYRAVDFNREDFDVAIRYGAGSFSGLYEQLLFKEDLVPVCTPQVLLQTMTEYGLEILEPEHLKLFTLLHSETCTLNWRAWLANTGHTDLLDECSSMFFDTCLLSFQAANAGLGFAVANKAYVDPDIQEGRLVAPFDIQLPNANGWHLVCPDRHRQHPGVIAFEEWLLSECPRPNEPLHAMPTE